MTIIFEKEYLYDLYSSMTTKDKKHRYQPQIIRKYIKIIDLMISLQNVSELKKFTGLHYEKLIGDKSGLSSVRVNNQYRIEFKEIIQNNETFAEVCNIVELSNHYQ